MVRFLHTADWHLGSPNTPEIYKTKPLELLIDAYHTNKCNFMLCVGDVFDTPKPDQRVKDFLLQTIIDNPTVHFVFSVGNHDYTDKGQSYHSLRYLSSLQNVLENVAVIEDGERYAVCGIILQSLSSLSSYCDGTILVWHGTVPGIAYNSTDTSEARKVIDAIMEKSGARYFALGDIHKRMLITNTCHYPGALYPKTYSCEHGFIVVDIGKETVSIDKKKLALPERVTAEVNLELGKDTEKTVVDMVKETVKERCFLKLKFKTTLNSWAAFNKQYIVDSLKDMFYEVRLENDPIFDDSNLRIKIEPDHKIEDELKAVIDTINNKDIKKDQLLKFCKKFAEKENKND